MEYTGPCPPDGEHKYNFYLYALSENLNIKEGSTKEEVLKAIDGFVLSEAKLVGRYRRKISQPV